MKKRNAQETKELILKTATSLFAKNGFDGLRVDELAAVANINKATIYYHFKDKYFIFETILQEMFQLIFTEIDRRIDENMKIEDKLENFLNAIIFTIISKRELSRIIMQELALNGKNMPSSLKIEFFKVISILSDILKEGINQKVFKDIDPFFIHATTVGSINYYYSLNEAASEEKDNNFKVQFDKNSVNNIKDMVLKYILI